MINTPYANLTVGDASAFKTALQTKTVGVGVLATEWQKYAGGNFSCNKTATYWTLNHMVLLVGYDSANWKIKNSWGTRWGVSGYMYIKQTGNNCGILLEGITTTVI